MKEQTKALLEKARENLEASDDLIRGDYYEIAASRAYYTMFYAAEALLVEEGFEFSSHSAVHGAFGERFAKTGRLDPALHRFLLDAYRARQSADYDAPADVSREDAETLVSRAGEFIRAAMQLLGGGGASQVGEQQ
jgi:uncharacterized protein (UPF0332 family)